MMLSNASYAKVVVFVGWLGVLAVCGCSEPAGCPPENEIRGVCAGVPQAAVCSDDTCTAGVACKVVTEVSSNAELQTAAAKATTGACIAPAPGTYGAVTLPGGVSLLGRSADDVTLGIVTVDPGQGAVLHGFKTSAIRVNGATGVKIASVHVMGSADTGVFVGAQSSVALVTSTIEGCARFGVFALDAVDVSLDRVVITGSGAPGLSVASSGGCAAPPPMPPTLEVKHSIVRDNRIGGIVLFGVTGTVQGVDILGTLPGGAMLQTGKFGGGLTIADCSNVDAKGLRVLDSTKYGVLVDASKGTIGGNGMDEEVEIHRNEIGLSIQNGKDPFMLENAQFDRNKGVGISVGGAAQSWVICKTGVTNTERTPLPTTNAGLTDIGDGLVWFENSSGTLGNMTFSGNADASVLIDGQASGTLINVKLSGGDETKGIVQQNPSGVPPTTTNGTPALQNPTMVLGVPIRPDGVPKNL